MKNNNDYRLRVVDNIHNSSEEVLQLEKNGSTRLNNVLGVIVGIFFMLVFFCIFMWALIRPYGITKDQVSPEFWDVKVKMAEVYFERTGNGYFTKYPEDVRLFRNADNTYYAVFPNFWNSGSSIQIFNEEDQMAIDRQIG